MSYLAWGGGMSSVKVEVKVLHLLAPFGSP